MADPIAAIEQPRSTGLLDLENELQCSICTEVLYQPLTLLDCLHTFCGSCLKEWFSWQAQRYRNSSSSVPGANPYTCPSCRASVRDTRPDAKVTTLLDMFLKVNTSRDRSDEEKKEIAGHYKPGDVVLPKLEGPRRRSRDERRTGRQGADDEDRRFSDEGRERARTETAGRTERRRVNDHLAPVYTSGGRSHSRERREREDRHRRRREDDRRRRRVAEETTTSTERDAATSIPTSRAVRDAERRNRERQIEHQSSLRSLMSASTDSEGAMEEEILRQIIEEGLLEGVNLEDLDVAQEDELSERIAAAYRQKHPSRRLPNTTNSARSEVRTRHQRSQSAHSGQSAETPPPVVANESRRPPASRVQLLTDNHSVEGTLHHRRRASDQGRRQTSPNPRTQSEGPVGHPAARSATDLSSRPRTSDTSRTRARHTSDVRRTTTEPEAPRITDMWRTAVARIGTDGNRRTALDQVTSESPQHMSPATEQLPAIASNVTSVPSSPTVGPQMTSSSASRPGTSSSTPQLQQRGSVNTMAVVFLEPSISCDRCSKPSIQYKLYKHCEKCKMDVCIQCYRQKRACRHWFGFGNLAMSNFLTSLSPGLAQTEPPHILVGRKYLPPPSNVALRTEIDQTSNTSRTYTSSDPALRLQEGKFCDRCFEFANACHWECAVCNDGEWGFCNECVNTQHCCTHPLLPLAHKDFVLTPSNTDGNSAQRRSFIPAHASILPIPIGVSSRPSSSDARAELQGSVTYAPSQEKEPDYLPLTFTTHCDICSYPIPPSSTRFHCPFHETSGGNAGNGGGDFDICTPCYARLVKTGAISSTNGTDGWRRCPRGHRMVITGFEERGEGQRRVVVKDLVGGWALKDDYFENNALNSGNGSGTWSWRDGPGNPSTTRASRAKSSPLPQPASYPPSGGVGLNCQALWSYLPDHEADVSTKDELLFPRGAEIREAEDINGDWYWGVYMGDKGVFPGTYVRLIGTVAM